MTRKEYLLIVMIEELNELAQELCKCLRFTDGDQWEGREFNNIETAGIEWSQVIAMKNMLKEEGFELKHNPFISDQKQMAVEKFYKHSRKLGVVE